MRYRQQTPSGDYQFGQGSVFLINSPATVAQAISTRMKLMKGEWFLDQRIGLDLSHILGNGTESTRDMEIKQRILDTPGVLSLVQYASAVNNRAFTVSATAETIYGQVTISETF